MLERANYTNGLGETVPIDRRNDVQLNKVKLEFRGWLLDPRFRYVLYTWTNNPSMGQGAQVVVGGNLRYAFFDQLVVGGGIFPLPSVRSNEGSWPYFLGVDHRTMADEFFRGSYTMGIFAYGELAPGLQYSSMLGNNLSILGVDAGQLDGKFATFAGALVWMPTTGEFGPRNGFGDFEDHQELATRIGAHFTFSPEDKQEQPGTDAPDNTQIRLSNGTIIFTEGALAPDVQVNDVNFYMTSLDAGMKYHGFSLAGEYYLRWLNNFQRHRSAAGRRRIRPRLPAPDLDDGLAQDGADLWHRLVRLRRVRGPLGALHRHQLVDVPAPRGALQPRVHLRSTLADRLLRHPPSGRRNRLDRQSQPRDVLLSPRRPRGRE